MEVKTTPAEGWKGGGGGGESGKERIGGGQDRCAVTASAVYGSSWPLSGC